MSLALMLFQITEIRSAEDCYFTDEETAACVNEAHRAGKRLCAHARARDSVKMCVRHGVDVIYHASYIDEEGKLSIAKYHDGEGASGLIRIQEWICLKRRSTSTL